MKKVIDSNYLQNEETKEFLSEKKTNFIVITDYLGMESYKGNSHKGIVKKYRILCEYPEQIIILKSTDLICRNVGRSSGLTKRMICSHQTNGFCDFCEALEALENGNQSVASAVRNFSKEASIHFDKLLMDAETTMLGIIKSAEEFSGDELREIRKETNFSPLVIDKIFIKIVTLEIDLRKKIGGIRKPSPSEIHNTFLFRFALAQVIYIIFWIKKGSPKNMTNKRLRNDLVDLTFAVYATYFDGLLSEDKDLLDIYNQLNGAIKVISKNAFKPPSKPG